MDQLICIILELAVCVMELGCLHLFLDKNCKRRKIGWIYRVLVFFLVIMILMVRNYCSINALLWTTLCTFIFIVYSFIIFEGRFWDYLIYVGIYIVVIGLCEGICLGIVGILFPQVRMEHIVSFGDLRYIFTCISKLFAITILLMISNSRKIKVSYYSKENAWTILCAFLISIISLYSLFDIKRNEIIGAEVEKVNRAMFILSICIFTMNIFFYWAINKLNHKFNREKEYELIQCQNKLLRKSVLDNEEVNNEWRKIRHDFNNHMSCIDMLLQMENVPKARAYIQKLTNSSQSYNLNIHTGNEIADAVINQKSLKARNDGISFKVIGKLEQEIKIEDMDLCGLLSNSIDNAIEAARQIKDETKREITILLGQNESNMLLQVTNSVKENINVTKRLITTKKDSTNHGIGMISMKTTVNKYGGLIEWKCEDFQFKLSIVIPSV